MAVSLVSRPEKTVNGFLSRWNASDLPITYVLSNDRWPENTGGTNRTINSVTDNGGYAQVNLAVSVTLMAKDYVTVDAGVYQGVFRIRSRQSASILTLDTAFIQNDSGTLIKYFNNYAVKIYVYAGIDSTHPLTAQKPYELIGTLEQIPDSDNQVTVDIREYIKAQISPAYQDSGNDISCWCDFYIRYSEVYDDVNDGVISQFESQIATDIGEWCHASYSALQFGNARGGNMYDYTGSVLKSDLSQWMSDFNRPKFINYNEGSISIIMDETENLYGDLYTIRTKQYDSRGNLLESNDIDFDNDGYGVYRVPIQYAYANKDEVSYITQQIFFNDQEISELITIDVDLKCADQQFFDAFKEVGTGATFGGTVTGINSAVKIDSAHAINFWGEAGGLYVQMFLFEDETVTPLDSPLNFSGDAGTFTNAFKIDSTHVQFCFSDGSDPYSRIFSFDTSTGVITAVGSATQLDATVGNNTTSVRGYLHDATHSVIFWDGGGGNVGQAQVFEIDVSSGSITALDSVFTFDAVEGLDLSPIKADDNTAMCFWLETGGEGRVQLFNINTSTWAMTALGSATAFTSGANTNGQNNALKLQDSLAINYWTGSGNDGFVQLFSFNTTTGVITALDSALEYDTSNGEGASPVLYEAGKNLTFWEGALNDGFAQIFTLDYDSGEITAVGTATEFETDTNFYNSAVLMTDTYVLDFYRGTSNVGTVVIFKLG